MLEVHVSGVVKGILYEDRFLAVSTKQAWYFFCKKYGFSVLDFKVLGIFEDIA